MDSSDKRPVMRKGIPSYPIDIMRGSMSHLLIYTNGVLKRFSFGAQSHDLESFLNHLFSFRHLDPVLLTWINFNQGGWGLGGVGLGVLGGGGQLWRKWAGAGAGVWWARVGWGVIWFLGGVAEKKIGEKGDGWEEKLERGLGVEPGGRGSRHPPTRPPPYPRPPPLTCIRDYIH